MEKSKVNSNSPLLQIYGRIIPILVRGPGRFCRSSTFFFHGPAEHLTTQKTLRYVSVRHHRSGVQKKQDDTRQSSDGPRTRTPSTYVIEEKYR